MAGLVSSSCPVPCPQPKAENVNGVSSQLKGRLLDNGFDRGDGDRHAVDLCGTSSRGLKVSCREESAFLDKGQLPLDTFSS